MPDYRTMSEVQASNLTVGICIVKASAVCTPLLHSLGQLSLVPFMGRYNECQLFG